MSKSRVLSADPAFTGLLAGLGAFVLWGVVFPVYIKIVDKIDPVEVVAHRIIWTVVMLSGILLVTRGTKPIFAVLTSKRALMILAVTALLVTTNWTVYIWAVMRSRIVEASLGYYINPLVNVVLGVVFMRERLSRPKTIAVLIAALGVLSLVIQRGELPWVSLVLPLSFGLYGVIRKGAAIDPTVGLLVETAIMMPLALGWVIHLGGAGSFGTVDPTTDFLLLLAGPMTFVPLVLFLIAGQRLRYSTVGLIQYITPTAQLLLGVLAYGEAFPPARMIAFVLIWIALVIYSWDALADTRRMTGGAA